MEQYEYTVNFDYTEGVYAKVGGKASIVPKHDRFQNETLIFSTYHETPHDLTNTELKETVNKQLQKRGIKTPYIVNIRVVGKIHL